ncbi:ATP-binding protein [Saprospiraceae bacterium]|nr:ATP-binding protein [Saprospiraceae bacterium]
MISIESNKCQIYKVVPTVLLLILLVQSNFAQSVDFSEVRELAVKGDIRTLDLLSEIKSEIDFNNQNELALQYFLIKYEYYQKVYDKVLIRETLAESEKYYSQSKNDSLKLHYELAEIYRDESKIENFEIPIKECLKKAEKLRLPEMQVIANKLYSKVYKRRLVLDSVDLYLDRAYIVAKENNLILREGEILTTQGNVARQKSDFEEAMKFYNQADIIFELEDCKIDHANILTQKGAILRKRGLYGEAIDFYQKALDIYVKQNSMFKVALVNRLIGLILKDLGNVDEAFENFIQAEKYIAPDDNPFLYARIANDIGEIYLENGELTEAEKYLEASVNLKEKYNGLFYITGTYNSLGKLYLAQEKYNEAQNLFEKSIKINDKIKSNATNGDAYFGLLKVYLQKNDLKNAKENGEKALQYAKNTESIETEYAILFYMAELYANENNYKNATRYFQDLMSLQDSVMNIAKAVQVSSIMTDYESKKTELEILNLKYQNQEKAGIIRENKLLSRFYILGLLSILITLIILIVSFNKIKKANTQQKVLNDSLNESIAQQKVLNNSLNESNDKLSQSNNQLEQFAHIASHDLKTPLRAIISFSSLLERKISSTAGAKELQYLDFIVSGGKKLSQMIDDLLSYSKVGAQELEITEFDLNVMMKDILLTMRPISDEKSVHLSLETSFPTTQVDVVKLRRVFQNILSNAVKFSDMKKAERFIKISCSELADDYQFSISDNGIGIAKTEQSIFQPFIYLNTQEDYKGTGMGLAMCENIIEKHGGKIWYDSEEGVGTTFYFTIKKL